MTLGHGCVVHNVRLLGSFAVVGTNAGGAGLALTGVETALSSPAAVADARRFALEALDGHDPGRVS